MSKQIDINDVVRKAKESVAELEYHKWINEIQIETLLRENEELKLQLSLLTNQGKEDK